jgi:hypothetical protein
MRRYLILGLFILFAVGLMGDITFLLETETPIIRSERFENELPLKMEPGEPAMAFKPIKILLPQGEKFETVHIDFELDNLLSNIRIEHSQTPHPLSAADVMYTSANQEIYSRDSLYPYSDYEVLGVERKMGYDILILNVFPYKYNPVNQELRWASRVAVTVITSPNNSLASEQNLSLLTSQKAQNEVAKLVINPATVNTYQKEYARVDRILPDPSNPYQMVIISSQEKEGIFSDYVNWKQDHGITTGFFTTNEIYANYTGGDNQEKIRNFIIDAYQTYSFTDTPLEYVILGGDDNIIPIRGKRGSVGNTNDTNMPSDLYYSNLDGNWDANGNGIYGEPGDDVDWFAEVALGRIPAQTDQQFLNFFHKSYFYVDNMTYSNDIAYMFGENLDSNPTWGGDYKDEIIPYILNDYYIDTLYERDGTFSSANVVDAINGGLGIINHIGHANYFIVFGLNNNRISNLNNAEYGFAYTQGCYPAAFDNATSEESGCVGQNLVTASGGLFAFIGNTRYGWYMPGGTNGPSQAFDITFFQGLYSQNIRELGHTMNYSKEALVNQAMSSGVMRWVYYELVLFGDPSIAVKDPNGTFPYIQPVAVIFDDVNGDGDGIVNPGETINIYVEIENLPNWADAQDVTGSISIDSDYITIIEGTTSFGFLPTDSSVDNNQPLVIHIDPNCPYQTYQIALTLEASGSGGSQFSRTYDLQMPVTLTQKHWPWHSAFPIPASPLYADFNNDGNEDIVVVDVIGNINILDHEAERIQDQIYNNETLWRSFSLGDINNDNHLDLVMSSRLNKILALSNDGTPIFSYNESGQQLLTPILADMNNDGYLNIVALDLYKELVVLDHTGQLLPGFPLELSNTSIADLAVADLNNDGYPEIVIGTISGTVYVISHDGQIMNGFPIEVGNQVIASPIILDNLNIALGTVNNRLLMISNEGDIIFDITVPGRIAGEIIAADFTNNGILELAFVTNNGNVGIVDQDGDFLSGFPVTLSETFLYSPLAADMTGDGIVNLIAYSSQGVVYGFNPDSSQIDYLPFPLYSSVTAPATITDVDGDGDLDIILATSAGINIVDYKAPAGTKIPWSEYRGNMHRTGFYGDNITLPADETTVEFITVLDQNYPNPFNPVTNINFSLKEDSSVTLEIFNIKGQKVSKLVDDHLDAGHHRVVWEGRNDQNQPVASGIYFYRLQTQEKSLFRKMMLIK